MMPAVSMEEDEPFLSVVRILASSSRGCFYLQLCQLLLQVIYLVLSSADLDTLVINSPIHEPLSAYHYISPLSIALNILTKYCILRPSQNIATENQIGHHLVRCTGHVDCYILGRRKQQNCSPSLVPVIVVLIIVGHRWIVTIIGVPQELTIPMTKFSDGHQCHLLIHMGKSSFLQFRRS